MAGDSAGFETYLRGSWWDVQIEQERSSMFMVRYTADEDEEGSWVPLTELRLSSRRADVWDCYTIKKGMDVAVLAKHPRTESLNLEKEGLYDARVSSVTRSIHAPGKCSCKFSLRFFTVDVDTSTEGIYGNLLDRILLTDEPEIEVSISDIRILQKPAERIPLRHVLDAHLDGRWIPLGRVCQDAYFLPETELSTTTWPRGALAQCDTEPAHVRSAEVLSPSPARVSEKNGERDSKCKTPVDSPQLDVHGSRESLGTAEGESRAPMSASGAPENHEQKEAAEYAAGTSPQISNKRKCFPAKDHEEDPSNGIVGEGPPVKKAGRPRREYVQSRRKKITRATVEDTVDIECTQLSSDTSDSETEWKPVAGLKKLPTAPSTIRTRDRTIAHKLKLEAVHRPSLRSASRSGTRERSMSAAGFKSHR